MAGLFEHGPGVVGEGQLVVALDVHRADVRLVIAGTVTAAPDQIREVVLEVRDLTLEPFDVSPQFGGHTGQLARCPGRLVLADK
ncbi:hypothetical protein AZH51_04280 [Branchiibius sp. NY16-3462-2]|nr:hypothetical protein AZH51_04280 [Branchiibius sp. NY16-3462-2]